MININSNVGDIKKEKELVKLAVINFIIILIL